MSKRILIFKAGKYPQGDVSKEALLTMAEAYNRGEYTKAPFVIGHRSRWDQNSDADELALGWVGSLEVEGKGLYACDCEFSDELKDHVAKGKLKYTSVELMRFDKLEDPKPIALSRVALLGRSTPAVKQAKISMSMFSLMTTGETAEGDEEHSYLTRKIDFSFDENQSGKNGEKPEENNMSDGISDGYAQKCKTLEDKNTALEKELSTYKDEAEKLERENYYSKLRDEGKINPAQYEEMLVSDAGLEGEAKKSFRKALEGLPQQVNFDAGETKGEVPPAGEYMDQIKEYQELHNVSFEQAANAVHAKNPQVFGSEK